MSNCTASGGTADRPESYKYIGIALAVCSGLFIGVSFVLKKFGLLKANVKYHEEAGEGYGYLKNAWWWGGMTLMIVGEICNFVAYSFADAILVTPLGALSVVVTTILSAIFLKERLSFVGKVGCFNCIVGSVVILLSAPEGSSVATIQEMQCYVISPGFLSYTGVILVGSATIALWAGPRYGKKSMLIYLSVCSLIGGLSVVCTQGLGAAILSQINGKDRTQFKHWFLYILLVFVIATLLTEIIYLNKALNIFNAALVTPTYYVYFTSATLITSVILFRGLHAPAKEIITIVLGFLVICSGVVLLQLSKSSQDVPDTKVLNGDLDQVRTVAEQEEHESEPKADAIRGTAALIRSFSKSRQKREEEEARRIHHDRLEPIGENELVEWEGLRRRKTVLEPGQVGPPKRTKTVHPPLGLTRIPSDGSLHTEDEIARDTQGHGGIFTFSGLGGRGRKAQTMLNPLQSSKRSKRDFSGESVQVESDLDARTPYRMGTMSSFKREFSDSSKLSYADSEAGDLASGGEHVLGLPSGLQHHEEIDTAYHSPRAVQFADQPRPGTASTGGPPPTPPPHGALGVGKRVFSFQNMFGSRSSRETRSPSPRLDGHQRSPGLPPVSPGFASSSEPPKGFFGRMKGTVLGGVSEEERLGLVQGDASAESTPEKKHAQQRGGRDMQDMTPSSDEEEYEDIGMRQLRSKQGSESEGSDERRPGGRGALV